MAKVLEELAVESLRDAIFWSPYAGLGYHLGQDLEDSSSDTPSGRLLMQS